MRRMRQDRIDHVAKEALFLADGDVDVALDIWMGTRCYVSFETVGIEDDELIVDRIQQLGDPNYDLARERAEKDIADYYVLNAEGTI